MKVEDESGISRQSDAPMVDAPGGAREHRRSHWWIFLLAIVAAALLVVFGILPRIQARTALRQETIRISLKRMPQRPKWPALLPRQRRAYGTRWR